MAARAIVITAPFMPLDYHPAAVVGLDIFFDENWGLDGAAPDDDDWQAPPGKLNIIVHLGAFFAEVLRREYGGRFIAHPESPTNVLNVRLEFRESLAVYPIARVFKRMKNGASEPLDQLHTFVRRHVPRAIGAADVSGWQKLVAHFDAVARADLADRVAVAAASELTAEQHSALQQARAKSKAGAAAQSAPTSGAALAASPAVAAVQPSVLQQALLARLERIDALIEQRALAEAVAACDATLALSPGSREAAVAKGRALLALGQPRQALDWLSDFAPLGECSAAHLLLKAQAADALKEHVVADTFARQGVVDATNTAPRTRSGSGPRRAVVG